MRRRPDDRAAHGRHADAVRIGTTAANAASVNAPQNTESAAARFRRADRAEGNVPVACADVFPVNREDVCKEAGSIFMQERAGAKTTKMRFGEKNTLPLRETRKSIRKSRDCAISRRAVRACPALRFGGFAVLLRLSYGHCAPAYACPPFFNDAGNNALPKARYNRYSRCNLRSPRQNGAPSPRAEEIGGALSPAAQRQRRTRAGVFLPSVYGKG